MSFKYQAQQVGKNHYVLPKCGSMKVEAHAFLSPELYAASEENVWQQIASGASYEGVIGAYLMPDCHLGYGVPVGGVVVEGIVGNHKHTPLDECAHVYKDLDAVLDVLEVEKIATIKHRLYPVANLKGTD